MSFWCNRLDQDIKNINIFDKLLKILVNVSTQFLLDSNLQINFEGFLSFNKKHSVLV